MVLAAIVTLKCPITQSSSASFEYLWTVQASSSVWEDAFELGEEEEERGRGRRAGRIVII